MGVAYCCFKTQGDMELISYKQRLQKLHESRKCHRFIVQPDHNLGIITKIYDGDTLTIATECVGKPCKISCRISGIDTPEITGKSPLEATTAKLIRDLMADLCLGKFALVSNCSMDKYGRLLANIRVLEQVAQCKDNGNGVGDLRHFLYFDQKETDIAKFLITNGLAYEYDGGTKKYFNDQDLIHMQETCAKLGGHLRTRPYVR